MGRPGFANLQSQKATLESPSPGPLRPQQTLESWGALSKIPIPGPCYSKAPLQQDVEEPGHLHLYMLPHVPVRDTKVLELLAESSSGRFVQFPEDLFESVQLPFVPQINKITMRKLKKKASLPNPCVHL